MSWLSTNHDEFTLVTTMFRHICDISEGKKWPIPEVECKNNTTGEVYLTPNFETTVNDQHKSASQRGQLLLKTWELDLWPGERKPTT